MVNLFSKQMYRYLIRHRNKNGLDKTMASLSTCHLECGALYISLVNLTALVFIVMNCSQQSYQTTSCLRDFTFISFCHHRTGQKLCLQLVLIDIQSILNGTELLLYKEV